MKTLLCLCSITCVLLLACLAICRPSYGESTRGELAGNVTDTSRAAIVGAKIVAASAIPTCPIPV
jgi:hypothetical protein